MTETHDWERLGDETAASYHAFEHYRDAVLTYDWERLGDETAVADRALEYYRDLPHPYKRSIDAAYREHQEKCKGEKPDRQQTGNKPATKRAPGQWTKWSTDNDWVERAARYDDHRARERRKHREHELKILDDLVVKLGFVYLDKIGLRVEKMSDDEIVADRIPSHIKMLYEVGSKALGRVERMGLEHWGSGYDPFPIEEVREKIRRLAALDEEEREEDDGEDEEETGHYLVNCAGTNGLSGVGH